MRHMISHWEQNLTDRIHAWGKPHYKLWYFFAVDLFGIYGVVWIAFAILGWLVWWQVPLLAFSSWILTISIQLLVGRDRPKFEESTGYKMWWRTYSMPSGHALITSALGTGILLQSQIPYPGLLICLAIAFLITNILVDIGRVVVGVHYFGDVVVGFVLGIAFGVVYSVL